MSDIRLPAELSMYVMDFDNKPDVNIYIQTVL